MSPVLTDPSANSDGALTRRTSATALDMFRESSEDDDDLDFEVAHNISRKAENSLAAQDHHAAKTFFQEGLGIADHLSAKRQNALELGQIRMRYADCCCYFTNDLTSAEYVYHKVMEEQPVDTVTLERVLTAGHELSIVKLRQRNTGAAEKFCRQTLNGRRKARFIGKDHPDYHLTLRLLTVILWAKGVHNQARHYAELLPVNNRPNLEQELAILTNLSATAKQWPYTTPTVVETNAKEVHAEFPKGEINIQGSADQTHPSKMRGLSYAIESKERKNGEIPDLDRPILVGLGGSRTPNQETCSKETNLKDILSEKKDEQSKIGGRGQQQQNIPHRLQQTSQEKPTAIAKPVSRKRTAIKFFAAAATASATAGSWLPSIEFEDASDPELPLGTFFKFSPILKVLLHGTDRILVNDNPSKFSDISDPTNPNVAFGSYGIPCNFRYLFSRGKGVKEGRRGWFLYLEAFKEVGCKTFLNGSPLNQHDYMQIRTGDQVELINDSSFYSKNTPRPRVIFKATFLMCIEMNGKFERREMTEDEDEIGIMI